MKAQQRRGPEDHCDFQHTLRRNEYRAQSQQDAVQWVQPRRLLSRTIQNQQLVFQKQGFGDDCAGTARDHDPDCRDNEMSDQDQPIPHAVNNDRGRRGWQDCDSAVNCGKLAIRHGLVWR